MRVGINLATRPFVELRPFFLRLRLLMVVLAVAGIGLAVSAHVLAARAARQQGHLDRLRDETIAAQEARLKTERRLQQGPNAAVLDRAHFLNALFLKKSFSWTAVMMDLEDVLPVGVEVTSIEPAVSADGQVIIRLRVAGERAQAVQLVRNLERSKRFLYPRLGSESAEAQQPGTTGNGRAPGFPGFPAAPGMPPAPVRPTGVEFEILANYNPLPPGQPYVVGRTRPASVARVTFAPGATPGSVAAGRPAASGLSPAANVRGGYPPNGVVLPPYAASGGLVGRRPGGPTQPPVGAQAGGGPR